MSEIDDKLDKIREKLKQLTVDYPEFQFLNVVATKEETDDAAVVVLGNACGVCVMHYLMNLTMRGEIRHIIHDEPNLEDMDVSDTKQ